jgi:hypothetical protein
MKHVLVAAVGFVLIARQGSSPGDGRSPSFR